MKKIIYNIALVLTVLFTSCSDDGSVNIVSLNTFGSKFCRNDIVKIFVSAEVSDLLEVTYEWGCDGGTLTNPQGLFENVWKAPDEAGTYEVWCTVECGGKKDTRRSKLVVTDELFYSNFETPYYAEGWSNSSMTVAFDATKGNNGAVKLTSTKGDGRFARSWVTAGPASHSMQVYYAINTAPQDSCFVETRFEFARVNEAMKYVTQACFATYPKTGKWEAYYRISDVALGEINKVIFASGTDTEKFKFKKDAFNYLAVSIDQNKNFIVYYNGVKFLEKTELSTLQNEYFITRSGLGIENKVVMFADDMYVFDNGTICTAQPRER